MKKLTNELINIKKYIHLNILYGVNFIQGSLGLFPEIDCHTIRNPAKNAGESMKQKSFKT